MTEETIIAEALEKTDPAHRAAYLDAACAGQPELRARVEALLRSHAAPTFLKEPAPPAAATASFASAEPAAPHGWDALPAAEKVGTRIGPYKLLQHLGAGGMGSVWVAEQEQPVKRRVALKVIRSGLDSVQVVRRFEVERQALALMDHPNIARVLDAGTTEQGRPYFVMELVKGVPITKYCDAARLPPRDRLALFIPVCQAVQHAHQKGIIHRDLKPSNILVALYDGRPVPKVIDFGVAKATGLKLTEGTLYTEVGQIVGTLEYMAPEQAELNNLDIDTRADVYALGVVLYELLTGSPPFTAQQLRSAAFTEMLRLIREVEPPRPSARLSSSAELPSIAARRQLEPRRLTRFLRGELDWVVMKCLEKERVRRYATANDLAHDLERFLADEPVQAGPPGALYRVRKFVRRHRGPVAAAVALVLALVLGIVATTLGLAELEAARQAEAEQRDAAEKERDAKADALVAVGRERDAKADALVAVGRERDEKERQRKKAVENEGRARDAEREQAKARTEAELQLDRARHFLATAQLMRVAAVYDRSPHTALDLLGDQTACPTSFRDAAWHFYDGVCRRWSRDRFHSDREFSSAAFSPDGKTLAVGGGLLRLVEVATGRLTAAYAGRPGWVRSIAFSPDGKTLASIEGYSAEQGQFNGRLRLRDVATGRELETPPDAPAMLQCLAFSREGDLLAAAGSSGTVHLWQWPGGTPKAQLEGSPATVHSLAFSPDGKQLAAAVGNYPQKGKNATGGEVRLWDLATGHHTATLRVQARETYAVTSVAFSPDGKTLAARSQESVVRLWDVEAAKPRFALHSNEKFGYPELLPEDRTLAFSPDGTVLAVGAEDSTVRIWEVATARELVVLQHPSFNYVLGAPAVAIHPDGTLLASARLHTVHLWDPHVRRERAVVPPPAKLAAQLTTGPYGVAFSPDGRIVALAPSEGLARLVDAATGREKAVLRAAKQPALGNPVRDNVIAYSADGKTLATACTYYFKNKRLGRIRFWDPATNRQTGLIADEDLPAVTAMAFHPDGRTLAIATHHNFALRALWLWDLRGGKRQAVLQEPVKNNAPFTDLTFTPDGQTLIADGRTLQVWDLRSGQSKQLPPSYTTLPLATALSADGKVWAVSGTARGTILYDAASGQEKLAVPAHGATRIAFSPDGKVLATGDYFGTVRLFDTKVGQEKAVLVEGRGRSAVAKEGIRSLVFSRDGRRLAAVDGAAVLRLWDLGAIPLESDVVTARIPGGFPTGLGVRPAAVMALSPDGTTVALVGGKQDSRTNQIQAAVELCDAASGTLRANLRGHDGLVRCVAYQPGGKLLATAGVDRTVRLWDVVRGTQTAQFPANAPWALAFSADGRWLAAGTDNATLTLWDVATGKERTFPTGVEGFISSVAFRSDGKAVACAVVLYDGERRTHADGEIHVWDVATGRQLAVLPGLGTVPWCVAFPTNGASLAIAGEDATVRLWNPATRKEKWMLRGPLATLRAVAFSPDGRTLAAAGADGRVYLCDAANGRMRRVLRGHFRAVYSVAFSPDGQSVYSLGQDFTLRRWPVKPPEGR